MAHIASMGGAMSPIIPISFFVILLLCVFGAIGGAWFQQLLFVGAVVAGMIFVCALEAWSSQEPPRTANDASREDKPSARMHSFSSRP